MSDVDYRARNWTFLLYPESMQQDAFNIIRSWCIPGYISPLHEPDGEDKKPHYHVGLAFSGKKSFSQIKGLAAKVGGVVPSFELAKVEDLGGHVRYMIHKDNPDKQQFSGQDVITSLCGFNVSKFFELTSEELDKIIADMEEFVCDHNITEMQQLKDVARRYYPAWAHALNHRCMYVMGQYIKSRRHARKPDIDVLIEEP